MSIRIILCTVVCLFFCGYAWKNYFASACAAIALMAIMQHPDVIDSLKSIGGIQGLNLWNLLMANVVLAWLSQRHIQRLQWDMPRKVQTMFFVYAAAVLIAVARMLMNPLGLHMTTGSMVSEYVINAFKWIVPGIILFDACRDRRRVTIALLVISGLYVMLALQVIKHVPLSYATGADFTRRAYKLVQDSVGYNRVTLSMMLGGASWATLALLPLAERKSHKYIVFGAAAAVALGQSLTGGRSGYFSWGIVGLILCVTRWRKFLPLLPIAAVTICFFLPGVRERLLMGLGIGGREEDVYEATSGRNIAWPYVIEQIKESPLIGFGREGMTTSGVYQRILDDTEDTESFPHPHNAYLETLLDSGLVGFFCVIPFFLLILRCGFQVFLDRSDPIYGAAGGVACALLLALLVAAMGGQTFYPREGAVGMWASFGVMLRVYVERFRSIESGNPLFGEESDEAINDTDPTPQFEEYSPVA